MTKVLLYWNHICILHNMEKKYLETVKQALLAKGIDLTIRFFGLGYATHMSEYLLQAEAEMPDFIISADLEVFEMASIFQKLGELHPCESWMPLKKASVVQALRRKPTLFPFVGIPLVCYTNDKDHCQGKTLAQMAQTKGFAFGGINNSAGKTLVKVAMEKYGEKTAKNLLENASVYDMPIVAFQAVRTMQATTAIVPSLYALRADEKNTFLLPLQEGTFFIPSYFCARTSVGVEIAKTVMETIISPTLCQTYQTQGDLLICPDIKTEEPTTKHIDDRYCVSSQGFLDALSPEKFYRLYTDALTKAKNLHTLSEM